MALGRGVTGSQKLRGAGSSSKWNRLATFGSALLVWLVLGGGFGVVTLASMGIVTIVATALVHRPEYTLRRLGQLVLMLVVLSGVIFSLVAMMPGDPVDSLIMANPRVKPEDVARLRKIHGLDDPLPVRYAKWLRQLARGDLGFSRTYKIPVHELIGRRVEKTLLLMGAAFLVALTFSVLVGVLAARYQYSPFDYAVTFMAFVGISIPPFWLGIMTLLVLTVYLREAWGITWFLARMPGSDAGFFEGLRYMIMPVGVLAFENIGIWSRYVRASLLEVLEEDYIRTARAKGQSEFKVVFVHGLRNALIPVVTVVALSVPSLFGGALITEQVFAWPGMGHLLFKSVIESDYYVALVVFMALATLTLFFNMVADLAYAFLDPRISLK